MVRLGFRKRQRPVDGAEGREDFLPVLEGAGTDFLAGVFQVQGEDLANGRRLAERIGHDGDSSTRGSQREPRLEWTHAAELASGRRGPRLTGRWRAGLRSSRPQFDGRGRGRFGLAGSIDESSWIGEVGGGKLYNWVIERQHPPG